MTPRSRLLRSIPITVAALAVIGVSACSPTTSGTPEQKSQAPTTSNSSAPSIDRPKNVKAVANTCDLLTEQQLAELGIGGLRVPPRHTDNMLGKPACDWDGEEFAITVTPNTATNGIDEVYKNLGPDGFTKEKVQGYPAVWTGKTSIMCRVEVGVSKNATIGISYTANVGTEEAAQGNVNPCENGERVAAMVLQNIPDA